jgi:proline iminopeptidase
MNDFFFEENQLLKNIHRIAHLPCIIVHGRYDVICRVKEAFRLYEHWPDAKLVIVQDSGHSSQDAGNVKALVNASEEMKTHLATAAGSSFLASVI